MVNINKLKGKVVERGLSIRKLAEQMNVSPSKLYRKIDKNGETFTVKEVEHISKVLNLEYREINDIFFAGYVACNEKTRGEQNERTNSYQL